MDVTRWTEPRVRKFFAIFGIFITENIAAATEHFFGLAVDFFGFARGTQPRLG